MISLKNQQGNEVKDLTELAFEEVAVTSVAVKPLKESVVPRRTVVYQTLMDPALVRIEGEKKKNKLFNRFLFKLNTPEEIEFVSIEKYYEPYMVVSGRHLIDYYRKCSYSVNIDRDVTEVILLGHTFTPRQSPVSSVSEGKIRVDGEERLVKDTRAFLILNKYGQESKLSQVPSAPSEESPQKIIKAFKMPEITSNVDLDLVRKRLVQHPHDICRVVNEELEIDERSVIYTPRFRLTYRCPRISKEACIEFDGVTLKQVKDEENILFTKMNDAVSMFRRVFGSSTRWITTKASVALENGKSLAGRS
jgi:hypothetical protein